jgi:hypothetical protein
MLHISQNSRPSIADFGPSPRRSGYGRAGGFQVSVVRGKIPLEVKTDCQELIAEGSLIDASLN